MKSMLAPAVLTAAIVAGTVTTAVATTVDTFSFTQAGYSGALWSGSPGVLSGTFTGTVEANGFIELADLSSIYVQFTAGALTLYGYGPPTFFSFLPGSASTLDLATGIGVAGQACVGAVAAFGFHGCGAGGVNGEVSGLDTTQDLATVTLTSQQIILPPSPAPQPVPHPVPPPTAAMPEPSGCAMLGVGLLGLARISSRRRSA